MRRSGMQAAGANAPWDAALALSRRTAGRGEVARARDILISATADLPAGDRDPAGFAEWAGLIAEHALVIGDDELAERHLREAVAALADRRTAEADAHLAPAVEFLRVAAATEGRTLHPDLSALPGLDAAIDATAHPGLRARCILARSEIRLDGGDPWAALEDAVVSADLAPTQEERAGAWRAEGEALGALGEEQAALTSLNAALDVFVARGLHLEAAQTRHSIAEIELRGSPGPVLDDLVATLLFVDALRLQFPEERHRLLWAAHVVEPMLSLALEAAVARDDSELVADLVASARSVGVPTIRAPLTGRGSLHTPATSAHEPGIDVGAVIPRVRTGFVIQLARDPSPAPVMPDGRIALDRQRLLSARLYPLSSDVGKGAP